MKKIRVVVVDDSALVRSLLSELINRQVDMACVGAASDPLVARQMIRGLDPDVITLDVEMPKMDGIEFLSRLMRLRPMPVVMISTLTQRGAEVTMRALELGAVDFVAKPQSGLADGFSALAGQIVGKIRIAASARVRRTAVQPSGTVRAEIKTHAPLMSMMPLGERAHNKWIFIGASTGGTEAIKEVLTHLPADAPGILITQHMPAGFTRSFADRLNTLCAMVVKEAEAGERILPGHAYIAPGGRQFSVERRGNCLVAIVEDAALVNRHMPSVEVLFKSAALAVGKQGIGVMLTGMGGDGASAMREMKDAGSYNIVQDEASSVVFGMPREAIAHGAADEILPVTQIASALLTQLSSA
ncbi:MAG: chemotaxis response regulator protein-glutamate methylesterase [Burkholderiales bacterium]|nr:chemotaxis response regulator protein-glutamate methylesterase [Burkholderiales bacterium]